jgi:lipid II:glycine glycyltransferase (peptidoglycan interpeptide bridge formation enzyme)
MLSNSTDLTDSRETGLWEKYLEELGWTSEQLSPNYFAFAKKIPLFGAVAKIPRAPLPVPFKEIEAFIQKHNVFLLKLEPAVESSEKRLENIVSLFKTNGFSRDKWALSPTRTIKIDLTKNEDELLKVMEKDTRYSVRLAIRRGVTVRETNDFEQFKDLYFETAKRKRFWVAKKELETIWKILYKEKAATILTAFYKEAPLASTLLLFHGNQGYYYHAASSQEYREVMAPYLLLWEVIRFLKKKGCKSLDLEGIYDPRNPVTKRWKGFTLFKRGFGGQEVEYIGSFVKYPKLWSKLLFLPARFF